MPETNTDRPELLVVYTERAKFWFSSPAPLLTEFSVALVGDPRNQGSTLDGNVILLHDERGIVSYEITGYDNGNFTARLMNDLRGNEPRNPHDG